MNKRQKKLGHFIRTQASNTKGKHKDTKMQMQKRNGKCKKDSCCPQTSFKSQRKTQTKMQMQKRNCNCKKHSCKWFQKNRCNCKKKTANAAKKTTCAKNSCKGSKKIAANAKKNSCKWSKKIAANVKKKIAARKIGLHVDSTRGGFDRRGGLTSMIFGLAAARELTLLNRSCVRTSSSRMASCYGESTWTTMIFWRKSRQPRW